MAKIKVHQASVSFPLYDQTDRSIKKTLISDAIGGLIARDKASPKVTVVQALEKIDLVIEHGNRVGLVGHNGAGKTTLLRVLAGIYEPNCGSVSIEGSIAPLFDIGLGMDDESNGFENIMLRGLFLGMTKKEIREKTDEIAEFSELGEFLHLPLRTYSTGMRMRLAFAASTAINPDILLLDEGIGAGDAGFLEKARCRMDSFISKAGIIVLASHSPDLLLSMCPNAILMEHGRIVQIGETPTILECYKKRNQLTTL